MFEAHPRRSAEGGWRIAAALAAIGLAAATSACGDSGATTGSGGEGGNGGQATSTGGSGGTGTGGTATTGGGGSGGASTGGTGGGGPSCEGDPITAPEEQWSWVPFPETQCGQGTPAGIGVNPTSKSDKVLIYLMGGGGCFTAQECAPGCNPMFQHCAANLDGYDQNKLSQELGMFGAGSLFDRNSPQNPFADYSFVFVPYCTGDFHSGNQKGSDGIYHVGFTNMTAYLKRVAPTFCKAGRVVLAGSSAGGFGSVFNYHQVTAAFGNIRVDLVDDSGPPLSPAEMPLQDQMRPVWGSAATVPPGCAQCATSWAAFLPYHSQTYPQATFSLVSSLADYSIGPFFGGPIAQPQDFKAALNAFADEVVNPLPNARVFYVDEFHHVYLSESLAKTSVGETLGGFLQKQLGDDPTWTSVRP